MMRTKKVITFTSPPMPKDLLDKLITTVIQEEGQTNYVEWSVNKKGELDLYEEDH
jgi:hypothetical protein